VQAHAQASRASAHIAAFVRVRLRLRGYGECLSHEAGSSHASRASARTGPQTLVRRDLETSTQREPLAHGIAWPRGVGLKCCVALGQGVCGYGW
jgi:hypothetical protein